MIEFEKPGVHMDKSIQPDLPKVKQIGLARTEFIPTIYPRSVWREEGYFPRDIFGKCMNTL